MKAIEDNIRDLQSSDIKVKQSAIDDVLQRLKIFDESISSTTVI